MTEEEFAKRVESALGEELRPADQVTVDPASARFQDDRRRLGFSARLGSPAGMRVALGAAVALLLVGLLFTGVGATVAREIQVVGVPGLVRPQAPAVGKTVTPGSTAPDDSPDSPDSSGSGSGRSGGAQQGPEGEHGSDASGPAGPDGHGPKASPTPSDEEGTRNDQR
jgi:hypothetical protein